MQDHYYEVTADKLPQYPPAVPGKNLHSFDVNTVEIPCRQEDLLKHQFISTSGRSIIIEQIIRKKVRSK